MKTSQHRLGLQRAGEHRRSLLHGIYGIVDGGTVRRPVALAGELLRAGIAVLQYRDKAAVDVPTLREMCRLAHAHGACVIVNDDFEAALLADGWHAGQEDLAGRDLASLRQRLGDRLFGISCSSPREAHTAEQAGADYIGVGPFAATATKADAGPPIGVLGLRAVVAVAGLPVVAIGGIGPENLAAVAATGAAMAAVISALSGAPDPAAAARDLTARWASAASP